MDEYADMKPEVWEEVLRPTLTDIKAPALFIGTPKGRNHFYDMYSSADLGADGFANWSAYHYTSYDNPYLQIEEIDAAKASMSSHAFRQEYMASFEAKGSNMFEESWISFGEKPETGSYFIACDLAGFEELGKKKNTRLDNTAIAVVKVNENGWFVEDIITGRWTLDETALKIFKAVEKYQPTAVGIERGIAKQAVISPLSDLMRRYSRYFNVVELSHGNKKKTDRIMWALQGRFENGLIKLNKGDWTAQFLDELFQFPDKLTHDDMVDALAYIDQLAQESYFYDDYEDDPWKPADAVAGY
jgi:predicted phage terminase large subunit-like protein